MPLVFAAIAPHGGDILEEIADDPTVMAQTRNGMNQLGSRFSDANIDTVVVLTPHGLVGDKAITVSAVPSAHGKLENGTRKIEADFTVDLDLAEDILEAAYEQQLPLVPLVTGEDDEAVVPFPLDWGALIPLWYTANVQKPSPRIVVLAPDRALPRETLVRCGLAIARAAKSSEKRIALIASCDQGHAHREDGPYGYDTASALHDNALVELAKADRLTDMLDWQNDFLQTAKVDGFWQTLILLGALGYTPMPAQFVSYEAPTYFGMMVVTFQPADG